MNPGPLIHKVQVVLTVLWHSLIWAVWLMVGWWRFSLWWHLFVKHHHLIVGWRQVDLRTDLSVGPSCGMYGTVPLCYISIQLCEWLVSRRLLHVGADQILCGICSTSSCLAAGPRFSSEFRDQLPSLLHWVFPFVVLLSVTMTVPQINLLNVYVNACKQLLEIHLYCLTARKFITFSSHGA
jgi:hypothetical protein